MRLDNMQDKFSAHSIHEQFSPANQYSGNGSTAASPFKAFDTQPLPPRVAQSGSQFEAPVFGAPPIEKPKTLDFMSALRGAEISKGSEGAFDASPTKIAKVDPFDSENCYQSIHINPLEGYSRTITSLPDLSATRIHTKFDDKSFSLAYTDELGRRTSETNFDSSGKQVQSSRFFYDDASRPGHATRSQVTRDGVTKEILL